MSIDPAKRPESASAGRAGVSDERFAGEIDRRVSVAPMMDWSGDLGRLRPINGLRATKSLVSLTYLQCLASHEIANRRFCRERCADDSMSLGNVGALFVPEALLLV
jgi:hypothetical protein